MSINIGDKVRFLNDVGGGTVVKIISKNSVMVEDSNEFEYPYPLNELVLIEKAAVQEKPQKAVVEESKSQKIDVSDINLEPELKDDNITEIMFSFIRKKEGDFDGFDCFLVNDSNYYAFYHVVILGDYGYERVDAEILEPNTKICIGSLTRTQINSSKEITIQMLFYGHPHQTLHTMLERKIKIVPLKFFQEHVFVDNDFFDEKAYIFELLKEMPGLGQSVKTDEEFERNMIQKDLILEDEDKSRKFKPRKSDKIVEVDLHINQLVDSVIGMSNAEIIKKQLDVFHKTITDAILNKVSKVILIHGIGNGTLKDAIRESLKKQYNLKFEDASFREYGFGATEVIM